AQYRLNQNTEALNALAKAWGIAEVRMPKFDGESGDLGNEWCEWIVARILLDEAKALVAGQSSSDIQWKAEVTRFYRQRMERYREAAKSGDPAALNGLAWALATCVDSAVRDGPAAVDLAEKAVAATNRKDANMLDTLAAAYAEVGRFSDAAS